MKNALFFITFLFSLVFVETLVAQKYPCRNEIGFLTGFNAYSGDLSEAAIQLPEISMGFGVFYRHEFGNNFGVHAQVYRGTLSGDDRHNPSLHFRKFRFFTQFVEASVLGEWHFLGNANAFEYGWSRIKPYLFAGVAYVRAQQKAEAYGSLQEVLHNTSVAFPEPGLKHHLFSVPFGLGVRIPVTDQLILGGHGSFKPVLSDHLDGVSLNASSRGNDWYYFLGVSVSYKLQSTHPCRMF